MSVVADDRSRVPVCESWIDDTETPVSAFLKLRAAGGGEPCFLLESADHGRVGRYSFIGYRPRKVLRWSLGDPGDPYALAQAELAQSTAASSPELPPFAGGAVGMFAYDLVRTVEPLGEPNPDPLGVPDLALMLTDTLLAFDHLNRTITVVAHPVDDDDIAQRKIAEVRRVLAAPLPTAQPYDARGTGPNRVARTPPTFESNMTRAQFEGNVARIIEYIRAGDVYQVVPSQRWTAPAPVSAFSIYRGLRAVNPSPYMYFLDFGDFQIAGASPEPLVTVTGRKVTTTPIAGTRPRGANAEEDLESCWRTPRNGLST
jgi:anthranilate synthase component 1